MNRNEMIDFLTEFCDENHCEICPIRKGNCDFLNMPDEWLEKRIEIIMKKSPTQISDPVDHPKYYATGKYECIDVMQEAIGLEDTKGFCLCNAFKYIYRCEKKNVYTGEDVRKAIWYLNKFLELEGKAE